MKIRSTGWSVTRYSFESKEKNGNFPNQLSKRYIVCCRFLVTTIFSEKAYTLSSHLGYNQHFNRRDALKNFVRFMSNYKIYISGLTSKLFKILIFQFNFHLPSHQISEPIVRKVHNLGLLNSK